MLDMLTPLISEADTVSTKLLQIILFQIIDPKKVRFHWHNFSSLAYFGLFFVLTDNQQTSILVGLSDSQQNKSDHGAVHTSILFKGHLQRSQ